MATSRRLTLLTQNCRFSTLLALHSSPLNHWSVSGLFRFDNPTCFGYWTYWLVFWARLSVSSFVFWGGNVQQVYMYFRGTGKAAEIKREATARTMMSALWETLPLSSNRTKLDWLKIFYYLRINLYTTFSYVYCAETQGQGSPALTSPLALFRI